MSAYGLPSVLGLLTLTLNWPCVLLLAGCALRIRSQKKPAFKVCLPQIAETVSLKLGMYLLAYKPWPGPPTSKPPFVLMLAASPDPVRLGNWATPFLNRPL